MIINFDDKFREYLSDWIRINSDKYSDAEEMEEHAVDLYFTWIKTPAEWLNGVCPNDYFSKFKKPEELVEILAEYLNTRVGVPDLLLDSISAFGKDAEKSLARLFNLEFNISEDIETEATMIAVNLLAEIDDDFMRDDYIKLLLNTNTNEDLADLLIERLKLADKDIKEKILNELEKELGQKVELRCMDILVNFPGDKKIYKLLEKMFNEYTNTSLLAAYLGKYGDDSALNILEEALDWEGISYIDYIEIRNSIEQLGKEVEHNRSFDGDKYYESLKNVE